jgi:F420-dependent oxidoreductase-like protein
MRFGIQVANHRVSWQEMSDFARFLDRETLFHSAWTYDHFIEPGPGGPTDTSVFEGWAALAALAAITERIRLGCLVTGVTYREPGVLAKMAATVDHISDGRLEFGIGAAWLEAEHRMFGMPFPPVRERQDRLEEAVHLIRLLFDAEGPVSFNGKYYRLEEAVFAPRCVQRPHPPIMVGGGGEHRTLRTLARYGDVMNVSGTPEMVRRKIEVLEQHCRDAGRDPAEIRKTVFTPVIVSDNQGLIDRVASMAATADLPAEEVKRQMPIGSASHVREVVQRYADIGVEEMITQSQGPWKRDIYARLNDEVVSAFS